MQKDIHSDSANHWGEKERECRKKCNKQLRSFLLCMHRVIFYAVNRLLSGKSMSEHKKETQDHDENNSITPVELFTFLRNTLCA